MLNPTQASLIYDVLVRVCGAREAERQDFIYRQTTGHITEWRFCGELGFGGKFWLDEDRRYVTCYPEDRTTQRVEIITDANRALALLDH